MSKRRARKSLIQQSREARPVEKAIAHNITGTGRSRTKRPFFDLDASDVTALMEELGRRMTRRLQQ